MGHRQGCRRRTVPTPAGTQLPWGARRRAPTLTKYSGGAGSWARRGSTKARQALWMSPTPSTEAPRRRGRCARS